MSGQFFDKVVLITGASSGIGRVSAQMFARESAKVVVADRWRMGGAVEGHSKLYMVEGPFAHNV